MAEVPTQPTQQPTEVGATAPTEASTLMTQDKQQATPAAQEQPAPAQEAIQDTGKSTEAPQGVPEKYEFTVPDGAAVDDGVLNAYSEVAKELKLSQQDAQKVLDKIAPVMQERQSQQLKATTKAWLEASTTDKEFGGEALQANIGVAKKALDSFGTPELRALLEQSGLGNHPEVIRFMYRAGKAISEDRLVTGTRSVNRAPADPAKRLYPNLA